MFVAMTTCQSTDAGRQAGGVAGRPSGSRDWGAHSNAVRAAPAAAATAHAAQPRAGHSEAAGRVAGHGGLAVPTLRAPGGVGSKILACSFDEQKTMMINRGDVNLGLQPLHRNSVQHAYRWAVGSKQSWRLRDAAHAFPMDTQLPQPRRNTPTRLHVAGQVCS